MNQFYVITSTSDVYWDKDYKRDLNAFSEAVHSGFALLVSDDSGALAIVKFNTRHVVMVGQSQESDAVRRYHRGDVL